MFRRNILYVLLACACLLAFRLFQMMETMHTGVGGATGLDQFVEGAMTQDTEKATPKDASGKVLSRTFLPIVKETMPAGNSCDSLYSFKRIQPLSSHPKHCIHHSSIGWKACHIGGALFQTSRIDGPEGGEHIESVSGRSEEREFLKPQPGALHLLEQTATEVLSGDKHWRKWLNNGVAEHTSAARLNASHHDTIPTLLVHRPTYANPCFWTAAVYNLYVLVHKMEIKERPRLVFMDGHAWTHLDEVWTELFDAVESVHVKQLDPHTIYERVYMVNTVSAFHDVGLRAHKGQDVCGAESSLHQFRSFVLNVYGLSFKDKPKSEDNKVVTFLVRNDYKAHPRSNGKTDRTVANLEAAEEALQKEFDTKYHSHQTVRFENKSFREQLEIITQTDILVGVHGAGHIHVVYLPLHAHLVEYFPPKFNGRVRFQYLAACLGIAYTKRKARVANTFGKDKKISVHIH